jgi:hypothetical protein
LRYLQGAFIFLYFLSIFPVALVISWVNLMLSCSKRSCALKQRPSFGITGTTLHRLEECLCDWRSFLLIKFARHL